VGRQRPTVVGDKAGTVLSVSLSPSELRQIVESAITAQLGPVTSPPPARPLAVSGLAYDKFPGADLPDIEVTAFAVGVPRTTPLPDRQRRGAGGTPVKSSVAVRFTYFLRSDSHVLDQDAALVLETAIVAVVSEAESLDMQRPRFTGADRKVSADGTFLIGDLSFEAVHLYPL
jgi:hypothetical protein